MNLVHRSLRKHLTRFCLMPNGSPYFESSTGNGPYVKVNNNHRWTTDDQTGLTTVSPGLRVIEEGIPPSLDALPYRSPNLYVSTTPSEGAICTGADPILGPPFAPVFYQLFIDQPLNFASQGGGGSEPAHLYWTIPDITTQLRVFMPHLSGFWWRVWFGATNNINQASVTDIKGPPYAPCGGSGINVYPSNYLWYAPWSGLCNANPTAPTVPTEGPIAVPGGLAFNGYGTIEPVGPNSPMDFTARPPMTWVRFELRRWRANYGCDGTAAFVDACTDNTNLGMPLAPAALGTTINGAFTTPAVGATVDVTAVDSSLVSIGRDVFVTTAGLYTITNIAGATVTIRSKSGSNNVAAGTVIATGQRLAPIATADDYSARDATRNYFYQLRGITSDSLVVVVYNNVGLIHPYPLRVTAVNKPGTSTFDHAELSWDDIRAEVATWPTTAP